MCPFCISALAAVAAKAVATAGGGALLASSVRSRFHKKSEQPDANVHAKSQRPEEVPSRGATQ